MDNQFATLAKAYEETAGMALRRYVEAPSLFNVLGAVRGLSILDAGCGSGLYTRWVKQLGAARVVGLDASNGMLAQARSREQTEQLGIEYVQADAAEAAAFGSFDLVIAVYLLPYAQTVEHLHQMCQGIARALRSGGRFVTLPLNPDFSTNTYWYRPYDFTLTADAALTDGAPVVLNANSGLTVFSVTAYYWTRETYEKALQEAGFRDITWTNPQPSAEGIAEFGADFWTRYTTVPHALILDCHLS